MSSWAEFSQDGSRVLSLEWRSCGAGDLAGRLSASLPEKGCETYVARMEHKPAPVCGSAAYRKPSVQYSVLEGFTPCAIVSLCTRRNRSDEFVPLGSSESGIV